MNFETPAGFTSGPGMAPYVRSFCAEPTVPIYAGRIYDFEVRPLNEPQNFGLPNTLDGQNEANLRTAYIRELYGRHYASTADNLRDNAAAFQVALWEIIVERDIPEGPMPFHLFTGTFQADYPNEAEAPEYVRLAQTFLQSLTGDDSVFQDSPALNGSELVRLNGVRSPVDNMVPQSQIVLRNIPRPEAAGGNGGFNAEGPGAGGPLRSLGGGGLSPGGLGRGSLPLGGGSAPLMGGGMGMGGAPFIGGGFGGPARDSSTTSGGGISPQLPNEGNISLPPAIRPPENIPSNPIIIPPDTPGPMIPPRNPSDTPPTIDPIDPIPAPAPVLLLLGGIGILSLRRVFKLRTS